MHCHRNPIGARGSTNSSPVASTAKLGSVSQHSSCRSRWPFSILVEDPIFSSEEVIRDTEGRLP
jgi:hypothetical protein